MLINSYIIKKRIRIIIFLILSVGLVLSLTKVFTWALKSTPTESVEKIIIESDNYGQSGTYHVEKKAEWIESNKVRLTFNVATITKTDELSKDVVFVIDDSESMSGEKLEVLKDNLKKTVEALLVNEQNRVAIITYDTSSEVLTNFTNNKNNLLSIINNFSTKGATNYNLALQNVESLLDEYNLSDDKSLLVVFLTDGYPNEGTPNQVGIYNLLKAKYPSLTVNSIQYEMGNVIIDELKQISDKQWSANKDTLYNVLLAATIDSDVYDEYKVVDYIDTEYFNVNSINDIKIMDGSVSIENENDGQKIIWTLDNELATGTTVTMTIDLQLKDEFVNTEGLYPTSTKTVVSSKLGSASRIVKENENTPVLTNYYTVTYDNNLPEGCNLANIDSSKYHVFSNVVKDTTNLSCNGYLFKGWQFNDNSIKVVNDNTFKMPGHDVTLKAIWSKPQISKQTDGSIYQTINLYKTIKNEALNGNEALAYEDETNDGGNETVYYYNGNEVTKNNVLFGDYCWQIIRTTDTGGVKMIYNGLPDSEGKCGLDRGSSSIGINNLQTVDLSNNYNYGTSYTYNKQTNTFTLSGTIETKKWQSSTSESIVGKYTCATSSNSCTTLYYVDSYYNNFNAYVIPLTSNNHYSLIGKSKFNSAGSLAYAGYMYNKAYQSMSKYADSFNSMISKSSLNTDYYYSDSYTIENGSYKLNNPQQIGSTSNYSNMVGMYTFRNSSNIEASDTLYYILSIDGENMNYIQLTNGNSLNDYDINYAFGTNLIDNNDGTYTISGDITYVKPSEFMGVSENNYVNKYTCNNNSTTCKYPVYVTGKYSSSIEVGYKNVSVLDNYKYGKSFEYSDTTDMYELKDTIEFYDLHTNYNNLNDYHYTCLNSNGKCSKILYIFEKDESDDIIYYIELEQGSNIEDAIDDMLNNNDINNKDSIVKYMIDTWYEMNLQNYSNFLEDTVYCNDRSISNLNGWNADGGSILSKLEFTNDNSSFKCSRDVDKFTVSNENGNGALIYPIGLPTGSERYLTQMWTVNRNGFWLSNPVNFNSYKVNIANTKYSYVNALDKIVGIRPVISLVPGIEYYKGDGTANSPFVISME